MNIIFSVLLLGSICQPEVPDLVEQLEYASLQSQSHIALATEYSVEYILLTGDDPPVYIDSTYSGVIHIGDASEVIGNVTQIIQIKREWDQLKVRLQEAERQNQQLQQTNREWMILHADERGEKEAFRAGMAKILRLSTQLLELSDKPQQKQIITGILNFIEQLLRQTL